MSEVIQLLDHGVEVVEAPEKALVTLKMLQARGCQVDGSIHLLFGSSNSACYKVTGWDAEAHALEVELVFVSDYS